MNLDAVGVERPVVSRSWTSTDAIIYALSVGAGHEDPAAELDFTTELFDQKVLPTFAATLVPARLSPDLGDYNVKLAMHAQEDLTFYAPLPAEGSVAVRSRVKAMYDKGSGVLVLTEADIEDAADGTLYARATTGMFFRGEGGFGGDRGPKDPEWAVPERAADDTREFNVRPDLGLLYRLNGDRNPLHVDPEFAKTAGFDKPILHGLCIFGIAGRGVLDALADGEPSRLKSIGGRLTAVFTAGDTLTLEIWRTEPGAAIFDVKRSDGTVVIGRGRATYEPEVES